MRACIQHDTGKQDEVSANMNNEKTRHTTHTNVEGTSSSKVMANQGLMIETIQARAPERDHGLNSLSQPVVVVRLKLATCRPRNWAVQRKPWQCFASRDGLGLACTSWCVVSPSSRL